MSRLNINFEAELNPDQLAAVTSTPDRPSLVLAGAGSGKTRALTYRVAWLISECGFYPNEILLLTFTNKAAHEMLERIEQLTGYKSWEFFGGTFHSVGCKILRIEGSKIGLHNDFTILDVEDSEKLLKRATEEIFPTFFSNKDNPRAKLLREIISYAANTCLSVSEAMAERFDWLETPYEKIEEIAENYEEKKRAQNVCDFDDLLVLWKRLLEESPDVLKKYQNRFRNILVDEYQDTNMLQSGILDMLANRGQITAVGDDAQCIYSWRGAEIENIRCFRNRYPSAFIYKIERNYRSTSQIINFANAILESMPVDEDYKKLLIPARDGNSKPMLIRALDGVSQGRQVADLIREIELGGRYGFNEIAVLYRSHFQAMDLQLQLQQKNIPFVMTSGLKFFEQAHIKDVLAQIKFAENPLDLTSFVRFLRFIPKIGAKTAEKIYFLAEQISKKDKVSIVSALSDKRVLAKVPSPAKVLFSQMASELCRIEKMLVTLDSQKLENTTQSSNKTIAKREVEVVQNVAIQDDFFASLDNLNSQNSPNISIQENEELEIDIDGDCKPLDVIKLACTGWYKDMMKLEYSDWEDRCDDFESLAEYAGRFKTMREFIENATIEIGENNPKDEENKSGSVRLMTVHQAKGLEFPVVFVIGAADGLFPTKRSIEEGDVDEEQRLFYVAATRAKDYLIISYPRVNPAGGDFDMREESRFLKDVDSSLYSTDF